MFDSWMDLISCQQGSAECHRCLQLSAIKHKAVILQPGLHASIQLFNVPDVNLLLEFLRTS